MNEQVRNILEQSTTKTSKIEQALLRLGLMRKGNCRFGDTWQLWFCI